MIGMMNRSGRIGWPLIVLGISLALPTTIALGGPLFPSEADKELMDGANVNGTVYANIGDRPQLVRLAGFPVSLRDDEGKLVLGQTDTHGRFYFPRQKPGLYSIIWETTGWEHGQSETIIVGSDTVILDHVRVTPQRTGADNQTRLAVLRGKVILEGSKTPTFEDQFFGVRQTVEVEAIDRQGRVQGRSTANWAGDYVIAGVPRGNYDVKAWVVRAGPGPGPARRVPARPTIASVYDTSFAPIGDIDLATVENIVITNRDAKIVTVSTTVDGNEVEKVWPGKTVVCTPNFSLKSDDAGGKNKILWKAGASDVLKTGDTFEWTLDDVLGQQTLHVLVLGAQGGYDRRQVTLFASLPR